jgi:hypothetical protein
MAQPRPTATDESPTRKTPEAAAPRPPDGTGGAERKGRGGRARKRADGEGTLYFDAAKRLWRGELMVGRAADGRRDVRKVSARTQAECRRRLQEVRHHLTTGVLPTRAAGDSLGKLLESWLASIW